MSSTLCEKRVCIEALEPAGSTSRPTPCLAQGVSSMIRMDGSSLLSTPVSGSADPMKSSAPLTAHGQVWRYWPVTLSLRRSCRHQPVSLRARAAAPRHHGPLTCTTVRGSGARLNDCGCAALGRPDGRCAAAGAAMSAAATEGPVGQPSRGLGAARALLLDALRVSAHSQPPVLARGASLTCHLPAVAFYALPYVRSMCPRARAETAQLPLTAASLGVKVARGKEPFSSVVRVRCKPAVNARRRVPRWVAQERRRTCAVASLPPRHERPRCLHSPLPCCPPHGYSQVQRLGVSVSPRRDGPLIWFHAADIGASGRHRLQSLPPRAAPRFL
eukprot:362982-Chlamydomonas_euryale.AAC.15